MLIFDPSKGATFDSLHRQQMMAERRRLQAWIDAAQNGAGADAHSNAGFALMQLGRLDEARSHLRQALAIEPKHLQALLTLSTVLTRSGELDEAMEVIDSAVAIDPTIPDIHLVRGSRLDELGRHDEAMQSYLTADRLDPKGRGAMMAAQIHLTYGRFAEGLELYERRPHLHAMQKLAFPRWQGEERTEPYSRVAVIGEQGLGDLIHFARYIPMIASRGWKVAAVVDQSMVRLFQSLDGCLEVGPTALSKGDMYVPLLSLPYVFATRPDTIPNRTPYLRAPDDAIEAWAAAMPQQRPRIGIVWAGNPANGTDHIRSIRLQDLARLITPAAAFISLQNDVPERDRDVFRDMNSLTRIGHLFTDFADTAAVIEHLDLVITVDTAAAHLAGALGKPVWILLPHRTDWRWFTPEREDSPWYPTARLFRQTTGNDWSAVIERVALELSRFCATHRS